MNSAIKSLRRKIAPGLHKLSYISGISRYKARRRAAARILMFHGVGGPDCPADIFESQMKYLKENFTVISLKKALEIASDSHGKFKNEVVLTFDDGLRNNYTIAYPILVRLGLPATFFVCPGLIESQKWQWPYEVEQRLLSCKESDLEIICRQCNIDKREFESANDSSIVESLIKHMKTIETENRKKMEKVILSMTQHFKPTSLQNDLFSIMNWDELCSLSPELITIGSHTVNHPILTKLTHEEMRHEIQESRKWLERRLKRPMEYFCYPNGDYDESTLSVVAANYKAAVTTRQGFFETGDDVYQINRIPAQDKLPLFAWRMFRP